MVATATITTSVNAIEPNKSTSDAESFGYTKIEKIENFYGPLANNIKAASDLVIDFNNTTASFGFPVYRESVIVYFKEMPASMDEFASSYGVTPIFVKDDIKMAAFESSPRKDPGLTSEKTKDVIEKISKDPRVEQAKEDTYMYVDRETEIKTTPSVKYPEDYTQKDVEPIPNQVMVGFWRLPPSLEEFGAKYGGKPINVTDADLRIQMAIYETEDVKSFIDRASKDPYVRYIELNVILFNVVDTIPNDEYWNTNSPNYNYTWGQRRINVPEAWDYQTGSDNIIVALLDSGIQLNHPDLVGRLNTNGWDFYNNDNDPSDDLGHGTNMAGIIASTWNNGLGYTGVSQSKILPVKVLNNSGAMKVQGIMDGLDYAVSHNAKIISMSFSWLTDYPGIRDEIANAYGAGCLLVASAGNNAANIIKYPVGYDNVVGVSAIDQADQLAWFSNFGSVVDLSAPGVDIGTTNMSSIYTTSSGTSPATAMVAGVAALVWSQNPTTIRDRILTYLTNSADDLGTPGRDDEFGQGLVNAYSAVTYGQMLATGSASLPGSGDAVGLSVDIPADSIAHTILAGNENSDFDIFVKWGDWPTPTDYDATGQSGYCLESTLTKGSGTLYIVVSSYTGGGNFKIWTISGSPTDGSFCTDYLLQGYGGSYSCNGWGKGYAFNSGPDGCNFDLSTKWNQEATPYVYDAIGETAAAQEYAGPVYGTGIFYGMTYSRSGDGEFVMLQTVY